MKVMGITGRSGSGKTTLIEHLLPLCKARGLTVNVIKHSHHDIELEPEGKDSRRFRSAGANEVIISSPYRYAIVHELRQQPEPDVRTLIGRLAPADLVLIEGFKQSTFPRIEVYRPETGLLALYPNDSGMIAVASTAIIHDRTCLPLDSPEVILAFILQHAQEWSLSHEHG
ncbi:molybdopterin-guanine dinucleotide biosynthesis protein B [Burkholderiaceae bacterium DAT-1]|nr:molybdopterin-guanine dinucleotide biosynthesis protein B [Burkholderiaceae bacterium DAT-1]